MTTSTEFQFLYGAIKSNLVHAGKYQVNIFQFLYGAIKSANGNTGTNVNAEFQFLYGAIKRFGFVTNC